MRETCEAIYQCLKKNYPDPPQNTRTVAKYCRPEECIDGKHIKQNAYNYQADNIITVKIYIALFFSQSAPLIIASPNSISKIRK